jgi:hypothetical protein
LSVLSLLEYDLFKELVDIREITINVVDKQLRLISKFVNLCDYLDMPTLCKKLGAIVAHFMKSLSKIELEELASMEIE